jgi:hypothetical protein
LLELAQVGGELTEVTDTTHSVLGGGLLCGQGQPAPVPEVGLVALVNKAAATLLRFANEIDTARREPPSTFGVILPSGPAYRRADGVAVIGLTSLGVRPHRSRQAAA